MQTTKSIAGHVSQRMVDRYAHIRLEAKRSALEALSTNTESINTGNLSNQVTGIYGNSGNRGNSDGAGTVTGLL